MTLERRWAFCWYASGFAYDGSVEPTARVYLVRHADVANPDGVLYGHLPNFGLSEKGREQAANVGRLLRGEAVAAIYCSPLQRAQESARQINQQLAQPAPVLERPALIEAEFGRYLQGTRYREVPWRRPRWWVHMIWPGVLSGDESMAAMARRVGDVIAEALRTNPGRPSILVSHGDPIQAYWATTDRRPPWALHRLQCAKGGLLELDFARGSLADKRYLSPDEIAARVGRNPEAVSAPLGFPDSG